MPCGVARSRQGGPLATQSVPELESGLGLGTARLHLHTQATLLDLGGALGDHEGHLFREAPGQLQEVNPEERRPGWELPVSAEDQQGLQAAFVAGQEALGWGGGGERSWVKAVTQARERARGSMGAPSGHTPPHTRCR